MASEMNAYYAVEPIWFPAFKDVHQMFLNILERPAAKALEAANKLFQEYECGWLEYKGEVYRFSVGRAFRQNRTTLYEEHPEAEIIHTVWDTFKGPMIMAQQCFAIATFHGCSDDFLAMKELGIPHPQQKTVEKFYEEFHALHALIVIRGLNE